MGRAPCCDKDGLKKGPWLPEEDQKLTDFIQKNGPGNWRTLPKKAGMFRLHFSYFHVIYFFWCLIFITKMNKTLQCRNFLTQMYVSKT